MIGVRGHCKVVRADHLVLAGHMISLSFDLLTLLFDNLWLRDDIVRIIFDKEVGADPKKGGSNYLGIASHYHFDNSNHLGRYFEMLFWSFRLPFYGLEVPR